jgi:DNA-binding GntR family transcriptional regulator
LGKIKKYEEVAEYYRKQIQSGHLVVNDYLPSEHEMCKQFSITRTTVRRALDDLLAEGFIEKDKGKGSRIVERMKSLGLLNLKGFSEAAGKNFHTELIDGPRLSDWSDEINFTVKESAKNSNAVYFKRLRHIDNKPIMLDKNWFNMDSIGLIDKDFFINGSFFKALRQHFFIEIIGSAQQLRAELANDEIAEQLKIPIGSPILHISLKFKTSHPKLVIFSEAFSTTENFPITNNYFIK